MKIYKQKIHLSKHKKVSTGEKIVDVQEGDKVSTGEKIVDVQEGDKVSTGEKISPRR
jgi:predicted component of viral defense system (DUF524 family)